MTDPSSQPLPPPDVAVWTDAARAGYVGRILQLMGPAVRAVAVGGARGGTVSGLGETLGVPFDDDFRKLVVDRPGVSFVLLASMDGVAGTDAAAALARGTTIVAVEPPDAGLDEPIQGVAAGLPRSNAASTPKPPSDDDTVATVPASLLFTPPFLRSPGWTSAADPLEVTGPPRLISFSGLGPLEEGSLYARLYDAWRTVLALSGLPDGIDASLVSPLPEVPDDPRGLTGHMAIHARIPSRCAAVIQVSDRGGPFMRGMKVVGEHGQLDVTDADYRVRDAAGVLVDHGDPASPAADPAELVAAHWRRIIDRPELAEGERTGPETAEILACCLASQLSARTGQPESPRKLLELHGRA